MKKYLALFLLVASSATFSASPYKYLDLPGGQRVIVPSSDRRAAAVGQQIWESATGSIDSGSVNVNGLARASLPDRSTVPLNVKGRLPPLEVAKAVGRFASKVTAPLAVGVAIYDLGKELGFTLSRDGAGNMQYAKEGDVLGLSCLAKGNLYTSLNAGDSRNIHYELQYTLAPSSCYFYVNYRSSPSNNFFQWLTADPPTGTVPPTPSTIQEFVDAVAAKSGWPSGSAITRVVDSDPNPELQEHDQITVTGRATSPGSTSTRNNPTAGTTDISTTTYNHSYSGDTVTTVVITNNTTTNNSTGAVISTSTSTSPAPIPPEQSITCGLPGTPACKIDETGTPEDPKLKPTEKVDEVLKPLKDFAQNPVSKLPNLPALNWSFALPVGCTAILIPAFSPFIESIDVCQFQPMFHDIMAMVWLIGGLLGGISLFWRNTFAGA